MGRGQGPQGGAGNQGGSLSSKSSNKSSKPKKPREAKGTAKKKVVEGEHAEEEEPEAATAYTVIRPSSDKRASLMRSQRNGEALLDQKAARAAAAGRRPVSGTAPTGEVLGGEGAEVAMDPEDLREARLQHLERQQAERRAAERSAKDAAAAVQQEASAVARREDEVKAPLVVPPEERQAAARAVAELPMTRRRHETSASGGASSDSVSTEEIAEQTVMLLDMLAERLEKEQVEGSVKLLRTVLGNAMKDDPKYRQLKALNDKLWAALLQHPELCAVLEVAGFQLSEADRIRADLQEHLDGGSPPNQSKVKWLMSRLEALQASPSTTLVLRNIDLERIATFVHDGSSEGSEALAAVLEATSGWEPSEATSSQCER
mmetsp:Transcript_25315/g.72179  ORF Transcript_25315/g.72179 Transcript_25315/m.72179 type:complete len:375 (-) Transcript_25315:123-1247(-)